MPASRSISRRVLIVDDQREVRRVLSAGLQTLGENIEIIDVPSGEEAILVVSRQPIDLLVVDVRLPGISGLELRERAKQRNPELKFILITGVDDSKIRRDIANAGAEAFFYKPIQIADFLEAAQRCLDLQSRPPAILAEPEPSEEAFPSLAAILIALREGTQAVWAALLDNKGGTTAQTGSLPKEINPQALASALMEATRAGYRVSQLLDGTPHASWMYFSGKRYELYGTPISQTFGLVALVDAGQPGYDQEQITGKLRQAAMSLLSIHFGGEEQEEATPIDSVQSSHVSPEELARLDSLFTQSGAKKPDTGELDAFWDSLSAEGGGSAPGSGAIPYEQARKLGLAPEED